MKAQRMYNYKNTDGTSGSTPVRTQVFKDEVHKCWRHVHADTPIKIWSDQGMLITAGASTAKIPNLSHFRVSKYFNGMYIGECPFREHSGMGYGGAKTFKKPESEAFGIELEFCFPDADWAKGITKKLKFCHWLSVNYPDWICERDGSLEDACKNACPDYKDHNIEVVSPPLSYIDLSKSLETIIPYAVSLGGQSNEVGDWYGLHITSNITGRHIKKAATKFLILVNSKQYRSFFRNASGRSDSKFLDKYAPFVTIQESMPAEFLLENLSTSDHKMACYPRSSSGGAMELRIFKTILDYDYLMAVIELTRWITVFSMSQETEWLDFLQANASSNLSEYLVETLAI